MAGGIGEAGLGAGKKPGSAQLPLEGFYDTIGINAHRFGPGLAAGLGLRERVYRIGGFVILAVAIGRIFIIDVWRLETLTRKGSPSG